MVEYGKVERSARNDRDDKKICDNMRINSNSMQPSPRKMLRESEINNSSHLVVKSLDAQRSNVNETEFCTNSRRVALKRVASVGALEQCKCKKTYGIRVARYARSISTTLNTATNCPVHSKLATSTHVATTDKMSAAVLSRQLSQVSEKGVSFLIKIWPLRV